MRAGLYVFSFLVSLSADTRLRDRLDRIVAGEYVQQTPELVPLDAAAAGGVGANGNNAPAWAAASGGGAGGQGW